MTEPLFSPDPANAAPTERPGAANREHLARCYEEASGGEFAGQRPSYEIFARWKSIGILDGIHVRSDGKRFTEEVPALVKGALDLMDGDGEKN